MKLIKYIGLAAGALAIAFTTATISSPAKVSAGASCVLVNDRCCVYSTQRYGSDNLCVKYMQAMINASGTGRDWDGYRWLTEDGEFGPLTRTQVKAFQDYENITIDGIVGRQTWTHLCYEAYLMHKMYPNSSLMDRAHIYGNRAGCSYFISYYND